MQSLRKVSYVFVVVGITALAVAGCSSQNSPQQQNASPDSSTTQKTPKAEPFEPEEGFTLLTLDDFETFQADENTWSSDGNVITCTGQPRGYIYSRKDYENFVLRFDYRFVRPDDLQDESRFQGNTGVLVYLTGEHKLWPVSLEVQGKYPQMAAIKANGGAAPIQVDDDKQARREARKPLDQWNSIEIVSRNGALTASINGTQICQSRPGELKKGRLGFQSEDFEVHFRNLRIRETE